jgi:hypothetical protein
LTEAEISKETRKRLESLECSGDILWYERLQAGRVKTEWGSWLQLCRTGTPDFICAVINKNKTLSLIFIENKKSDGGRWTPEQQEFCNRLTKNRDVHYWLVTDPSTLSKKILEIAFDRLSAIEF